MPAKRQPVTEWVISSHSLNSDRDKAIFAFGKEKGEEEYIKKHYENINQNLLKTYKDTSTVLERLKAEKIDIISARLKIESAKCFKVLLSVKDTDKQNALNLEGVYRFIYDLEEKINSDEYVIDFSIIKANENFSDTRVESDGYIYKHRLFVNEEETRTA